jgi:hypothetical protein
MTSDLTVLRGLINIRAHTRYILEGVQDTESHVKERGLLW